MASRTTVQDRIMDIHQSMKEFKRVVEDGKLSSRVDSMKELSSLHSSIFCGSDCSDICELTKPVTKDAPLALQLRNIGNEFYGEEEYEEAFVYYAESVATAPIASEELALAFSNRSAVLLKLTYFESCLLDINRALASEYLPDRVRSKLLTRKTFCWEELRKENRVKELAVKGMRSDSFPPLDRKMYHRSEISIDDTDSMIDYSSFEEPLWNTQFDNSLLPNVSRKIKLAYSPEWKRHLVATDDIEPGEVLFIQEYFSCRILPNKRFHHCAYCTTWCLALIPCLTCTQEMYCCEKCRSEAYDSYHRTECKIYPLLSREHRFAVLHPLRVFLKGTQQGVILEDLMNNPKVFDTIDGKYDCVDVPYANDCFSVLNLSWKIQNDSFTFMKQNCLNFEYLLLLFNALRQIHFFDNARNANLNSCQLTDVELFSALLLFQHINIRQRYCCGLFATFAHDNKPLHKLTLKQCGVQTESDADDDGRWIGSGLGMLKNHMNHSCDANSYTVDLRRRSLVFSVRPIKSGEQIFTTCGPAYLTVDKGGRKTHQEMINIECTCRACVENWPLRNVVMEERIKFLTKDKEKIKEVNEIHKWLLEVFHDDYGYKEEDFLKACKFREVLHKYVKPPSSVIILCEEFIVESMGRKANTHIVQSLNAICEEIEAKLKY